MAPDHNEGPPVSETPDAAASGRRRPQPGGLRAPARNAVVAVVGELPFDEQDVGKIPARAAGLSLRVVPQAEEDIDVGIRAGETRSRLVLANRPGECVRGRLGGGRLHAHHPAERTRRQPRSEAGNGDSAADARRPVSFAAGSGSRGASDFFD